MNISPRYFLVLAYVASCLALQGCQSSIALQQTPGPTAHDLSGVYISYESKDDKDGGWIQIRKTAAGYELESAYYDLSEFALTLAVGAPIGQLHIHKAIVLTNSQTSSTEILFSNGFIGTGKSFEEALQNAKQIAANSALQNSDNQAGVFYLAKNESGYACRSRNVYLCNNPIYRIEDEEPKVREQKSALPQARFKGLIHQVKNGSVIIIGPNLASSVRPGNLAIVVRNGVEISRGNVVANMHTNAVVRLQNIQAVRRKDIVLIYSQSR
ncbi:MAG: hypothetical protein KDK39_17050 [Leptospiraceae bacterium]|nr:hypothetical protein [Leptospiraceae bacterium]